MKKLIISSIVALLFLSCSISTPDNSSPSPQTPLLGGAGVGSLHSSLDFSDLEKEYKSFSTKALSDAYVSRMFSKFLTTSPNPSQVIRQLEFARYLKDVKSDSSYFNSLKTFINGDISKFNLINNTTGVSQKKTDESATFGGFVDSLNPSAIDTDAQAFITAAGINDTNQQNAIKTLVTDLKTYSIWTKLKAVYPFVGGTANTHKWNLKDPRDLDAAFRLTFSGGWTHSATGAKPDGTSGYANTYLNPSSTLTLNNAQLSYYSRTNVNTGTDQIDIGCTSGNNFLWLSALYKTVGYNNILARNTINDASHLLNGGITTDSRGFYQTYKVGTIAKLQQNATILHSLADNGSLPNMNVFIGAFNQASPNYYSNRETAFATIGDSLNDADASNLYTAVQKFETTLGRYSGTPYGITVTVSDPDAQTFINAAVITDSTHGNAINTLVTGMKSQGLWSKMKAIYPFVGSDEFRHKWNLKDPRDLDASYRLKFYGGWTHSATGAKPNGTDGYANTNLNLLNVFGNNNYAMGFYSRTNSDGLKADLGAGGLGGGEMEIMTRQSDTVYVDVPGYPAGRVTAGNTNSTGFYTVSNDSVLGRYVFKNGNSIINSVYKNGDLPNRTLILADWIDGGYSRPSNRENAFTFASTALTTSECANLYTLIQAYETTLGREVN